MRIPGRIWISDNWNEFYDEFFAWGPGAMAWDCDEEGRRVLWFIAPRVGEEDRKRPFRFRDRTTSLPKGDLACIYTERSAEHWSVPGDVKSWNGNLEYPTFVGSIWLYNKRGWHGFIRGGDLVTC